jgi:uncharacterized protein
MDKLLEKKIKNLKNYIASLESAIVAFSGGVDSTLLLKIASEVLKDRVLAVTAKSPIFPQSEFKNSKFLAKQLGIKHIIFETYELNNSFFTANDKERCYHCKNELFKLISNLAKELKIKYILDGSNYEDIGDYRPGMRAAERWEVLSPLKEVRLTKKEIRIISKELNLPTWDKPAAACLASRIPYGTKITKDLLLKIDDAESVLKNLGFNQVRVRHHGNIARIEIPSKDMKKILGSEIKSMVVKSLKKLGYIYITLDIEGYATGSMNKTLK